MSRSVMIVGGGRVGTALAGLLADADHTLVVLEAEPGRQAVIRAVAPSARLVARAGTEPAELEAAGIRTAEVVVAVTDDDARNLLVCALARFAFAVPRTIARIVDPRHAWLFVPACGVDLALDQADLLARLVVEELSLGELATLATLRRGDLRLVEERVAAGARADGAHVRSLPLPPGCTVLAVLRGDDVLAGDGDLELRAGDEVLALARAGTADGLAAVLGAESTR
jgi:trk system potassium uptake protein TrkA